MAEPGSHSCESGAELTFDADLQLLHGMRDLHVTLLVHEPVLLATTLSPANLPQLAYALQDGSGHLGSMIRGSATLSTGSYLHRLLDQYQADELSRR